MSGRPDPHPFGCRCYQCNAIVQAAVTPNKPHEDTEMTIVNDKKEQAMLAAHQLGRSDYRAGKPMAPPSGLYAQERVSYCAGWLGEKTRAMGKAIKVNNYECGVYQDNEVFIQTEPRQLEANQGRVYLTVAELRRLLDLAEVSDEL